MSRIGKLPIQIPAGVKVDIDDARITVTGPKGELSESRVGNIHIKQEEGTLRLEALDAERQTRSYHGLMRTLINNMVVGVSEGFKKRLKIVGVGYRGEAKEGSILLNVGYSHPVDFALPEGISATVSKDGTIEIEGINKQVVGDVAARIRKVRPPDSYKGKGIRYIDEVVKLKPGKSSSK